MKPAINQPNIRFCMLMGKGHITIRWRVTVTIIFMISSIGNRAYAQLGIGGGFEYGTALVLNNGIYARRPSMGVSGILSYAPRESKMFPSFTYLLKSIALPISNDRYSGLVDFATCQNFALNLNYRTTEEPDYYLLFMGIGLATINPDTYLYDNNGNTLTLIDTASVNRYPLIQLGGKYMHRILGNSSFYLGLEANLRYIRMHPDVPCYLQEGRSLANARIGGDIISPGVQIQLNYFFDKGEE
jgi:hypothetical protein